MAKENVQNYFLPEDAKVIKKLTPDLEKLVERHPELRQVNIVIEGGVGSGRIMVQMMKKVFPHALYVGMDVADLVIPRSMFGRTIDEGTIQKVLYANKHPDGFMRGGFMRGAMMKASCVDFDLIRDIMEKTGRSVPLLATYNALYSLMHTRERNRWEKKKSEMEIVTVEKLTSPRNPFFAQIHEPIAIYEFTQLETAAMRTGWKTDKYGKSRGLLLLRKT